MPLRGAVHNNQKSAILVRRRWREAEVLSSPRPTTMASSAQPPSVTVARKTQFALNAHRCAQAEDATPSSGDDPGPRSLLTNHIVIDVRIASSTGLQSRKQFTLGANPHCSSAAYTTGLIPKAQGRCEYSGGVLH